MQRGLSLVELMIALVISSILLLGLSSLFIASSHNFSETERVSRQIENGRYASAVMRDEIRHAGFYGEISNVVNLPPGSSIAMPGAIPDPCLTAIANVSAALPLPIQGFDETDAAPSCVPDRVTGTDIVVVRRAHTTSVAAAAAVANGYYTQTSNCNTDPKVFQIAQTGFTLKKKDCAADAVVRQYHVYIYYIAPCSIATGGSGQCVTGDPDIPTLKRVELLAGGTFSNPVPLVEGIENMQAEYGLDTSGDGYPDTFKAKPASVTEWSQVVSIRLHVVARNNEKTGGFTDTKTYPLGLKADGTLYSFAPGGAYRRHAYKELVRVTNVGQRLEPTYPTP
jgi:type IV pilus assembly protein PilW